MMLKKPKQPQSKWNRNLLNNYYIPTVNAKAHKDPCWSRLTDLERGYKSVGNMAVSDLEPRLVRPLANWVSWGHLLDLTPYPHFLQYNQRR